MIEKIIKINEERIKNDMNLFNNIKRIDFIDIFPTSEENKKQLDDEANKTAEIIDKNDKGTFYLLNSPIMTKWGELKFLKIRFFDETRLNWEAAPDFEVENWNKLKEEVANNPKLSFISREKWDAIEYKSDNALIYFLNPLVTSVYNIK